MLSLFDVPIYDYATRQLAADAAERAGNFLLGAWLRQRGPLVLDGNLQPVPNPSAKAFLGGDTPLDKLLQPVGVVLLNWVPDGRNVPLRIQCDEIAYHTLKLDTAALAARPLNTKNDEPKPEPGLAIYENCIMNGKGVPPMLHVSPYDLHRFGLTFVPDYAKRD